MRKRLIMNLAIVLLASLLVSTAFILVPAAGGSDQSEIIDALGALRNDILNLPPGADGFKNPRAAEGQRNALCNKINAVIHQVEAGAYKGAVNKLRNDIENAIEGWVNEQWVDELDLIEKVEYIIDLILGLIPPIHDIAITDVTASPTEVYVGESVYINVTVANQGTKPETFNVSVYYDSVLIETRTGVSLATCTRTTLTFIWDTADVAEGIYTISANATVVEGETDTEDNTYVDGTVTVLVPIPHKGWINGTVIDAGTGLLIEGANVTAGGYSTLTAANGTYEIEVYAPATYNVKASAEGYYTQIVNNVFVDKQATVTVDFALIPIWPPVVIPGRPVASFTWSPLKPVANETVTFNATASYDPDGSIDSYLWIFGDGASGTGEIVEHIYTSGGTYTVTLFVTDNDGLIGSASANITVSAPPVAIFTYSLSPRLTPYTGETVTFNATASYDPDGYIVSYFWDFGDGTNATGVITTHAYADDGIYTVTLNVTDNDGLSDIATADVTVLNRPPVAVFTESATTVLTGGVINFDASGSYDPDGYIVSYVWDFGDGTDATGKTVTHAYANDGTYTVTLTVTDDDGASASVSATKTVLNRPPVASFTESAETVAAGVTITFNASGSYDPDGTIVSYVWDFGDGTTATGVVVEHSYAKDGTYNVTLTVTDNDGAFSSESATKTVETPAVLPLAWLAAIGLGIAALTATLLYALYRRRKKGRSAAAANPGNEARPKPPVVALYVPAKIESI